MLEELVGSKLHVIGLSNGEWGKMEMASSAGTDILDFLGGGRTSRPHFRRLNKIRYFLRSRQWDDVDAR